MKKILTAVIGAACAALSSFATDYYVGGENAADEAGHGTADAPFATITYALGKAKTAGDVVYVAEGTYSGTVTIPTGVGVEATGLCANTIIDGGYDSSVTPKSGVRGVSVGYNGAYIKGFTIRNCYSSGSGAGAYVNTGGAAIQCAFYNCCAVYRGGAGSGGGTFIGCYFDGSNADATGVANVQSVWFQSMGASMLINCMFSGQGCYGNGVTVLNCTFTKGAVLRNNSTSNKTLRVYNSLVGNYMSTIVPTNSVFVNDAKGSDVEADERSVFKPSDKTTVAIDGSICPARTATLLLGKSDKALYDELFPAAWAAYKNVDFNLQPRFTTGDAMDIGANQRVVNDEGVWYVDGETGDDGNFGTSPSAAKKTLAAGLAMCASGDVVKVAPGTYAGDLAIPAGVGVVATGSRANTIIDGAGAKQAVSSMGALSYIKGFTIQNCYYSGSGGAIVAPSNAAVIDCWFFNNTSGYRGAAGTGGMWIRCYFDSTHTEPSNSGTPATARALYEPVACYNCVFNGQGSFGMDGSKYVGCTFVSPASVGPRSGSVTLLNSIYYSTFNTVNVTVCQQESSPAANLNADYTPKGAYAAVLGQASVEAYANATNGSPWAAYLTVDYLGRDRTREGANGMDIGACQYDWTQDTTIGFTFTKEAAGEGQVKFTFTRNGLSAKPLVSLTFGGETLNFDDDGETGSITVAGSLTDMFPMPTLVYDTNVTMWYVDPANGSDANNGGRFVFAFKTVSKGLAAAKSGHVVKLAEGTYEGGIAVPAGVGLEAYGTRANTIIDGGMDEGKTSGKRAATLNALSYIKGFTITNCYSTADGAVNAQGLDAAIIGCAFYNCWNAYRGGAGGNGGYWIGCYFNDDVNSADGNPNGNALWTPQGIFNCVFNTQGSFGYNIPIVNSTYRNGAKITNNAKALVYNTIVDVTANACVLTNCVSSNNKSSDVLADEACVFNPQDKSTIALNANYMPAGTATLLIGKGVKSYYDDIFPASWTAFKDVDFNGRARWTSDGCMDIGACQSVLVPAPALGYTYTVVEAETPGQVKFTFTRNGLSAKPLILLTFGGQTLNFDIAESGSITVDGALGDEFPMPTLTYDTSTLTTWYVDDANGSDANNGGRATMAFKTIAKALTVAKTAGNVVKVAEGTYAGDITLTAGVGLEATGARANTIIDGGMDKAQANTNDWTKGVIIDADGAYVKGFTIQNCYSDYGAGVRSYKDGAVIGCAFSNCYASVRGGACASCNGNYPGATCIGCYFDASNDDGNGQVSNAKGLYVVNATKPAFVANCVFNGQGFFGNNATILNCTFDAKAVLRNNSGNSTNVVVVNSAVYEYMLTIIPTNSVFVYSAKGSDVVEPDARTVFKPDANRVKLDENYCPKQYTLNTYYVDKGDVELYNALFPAKWAAYKDVDFNGNARVGANGKMDIGAGQHTWAATGMMLYLH